VFPEDTLKASEHRAKRLLEDPKAYLRFGPYCWAVMKFAEDYIRAYGVQTNEYGLDGRTFLLYAPDQAQPKA
jgi:hypothetical protein